MILDIFPIQKQVRLICTGLIETLWLVNSVKLIARQKVCRRHNIPKAFPLVDGKGVIVINDRRRLHDRRKAKYGLDDLKAILAKMAEING